jgi:ubiquinone/menaquinone biosynthesis C-methylase UbiE
MSAYLFGDTDIAAQRLRLLADMYAASTRAFLQAWTVPQPQVVVDLGCGLGYTTQLLADVFQSRLTIGLDNAGRLLTQARQQASENLVFYQHDVTQVPFPVTPVDVLFCRLLLTHLRQPQAVIERWATQLQPQGRLLLQEVEWIRTNAAVFITYLDMQRALFTQQANCLDIGPLLEAWPGPALLQKRSSQVRQTHVAPAQAAMMFALNFQTWQHHRFIQDHYTTAQIRQVEQDLRALSTEPCGHVEIVWGFRQLVYERRSCRPL